MVVQAASLEVLEKAAVPPAQARAIVQAIEIEIAGASDRLATKHDLSTLGHDLRGEMAELRAGLRAEMAELRSELKAEMGELRSELKTEMGELRSELKAEMGELRSELKAEMGELRPELKADIAGLRHEVTEKFGALRGEFHAAMTNNVRHTYAALSAHFALLLGVAYFFVSHLQR